MLGKMAEKMKSIKASICGMDAKKKRLCIVVALLILLCVSLLVAFLISRSNKPIDTKPVVSEENKDKPKDEEEDPNAITDELLATIPDSLPGEIPYEVLRRVGLDMPKNIVIEGKKYLNGQWTEEGAVYGKAFRFASNPILNDGKGYPGECTVQLGDPVLPDNVRGVMFYVDFSDVTPNPELTHGLCASVTFNGNTYRSKIEEGVENSGVGYYYWNNEWTQTEAVNACRMSIPDGFKGWLYVPLTSYTRDGQLYDAETGLGLPNVWIENMNLYTNGYVYAADKFTLFDEILFVTSDEPAYLPPVTETAEYQAVVPKALPGNVSYTINGRIPLDSAKELKRDISGKFYDGQYTAKGAIFGNAYKFACDMTLNDGKGNRGECTYWIRKPLTIEGDRGVMFYVDTSDVTPDTNKRGIGVTVTIGIQCEGTKYQLRAQKEGTIGYYCQNGKWVATTPASGYGDRMVVPDGFKGWVYIPFTSYKDGEGKLYDAKTGLGLKDTQVIYSTMFTEGYVYTADHYVLYDEICFVSSSKVAHVDLIVEPPITETADFLARIPSSLPGNVKYNVKGRIGLDSEKEISKAIDGKFANGQWTANGAAFGSAYKFACDMTLNDGKGNRGEVTVNLKDPIAVEGTRGVLYYVDFSDVTADSSKNGIGVAVTIGVQCDGTKYNFRAQKDDSIGYYYQNGEWVETAPITGYGDRMQIPNGFKGWMYVPYTSYKNAEGKLYDAATGLGRAEAKVIYTQLFTEGYEYTSDHYTLFDEILFIASDKVAALPAPEPIDPTKIPNEVVAMVPENLPGRATYEIKGRVGLDSEDEVKGAITGKFANGQFTAEDAAYGSAYKFACNMALNEGAGNRGECTINLSYAVSVEGSSGVLWYVDFSDVKADSSKAGIGTTVSLGIQYNGEKKQIRSYASGAVGYYYQDGEWVATAPATGYGDRMVIPEGFAGWMYIPFASYRGADTLYDAETGLGLAGAELVYLQLYTEGYEYTSDHYTLFDEVMFTKVTGVSEEPEQPENPEQPEDPVEDNLEDVIPGALHGDYLYEVADRISMNADTDTAANSKYWGKFIAEGGVCGSALQFASGVYQNRASGATTALDPATVTEGTLVGGETSVTPDNTISLEGVTGIMWYVDFSGVEKGTQVCGFCTSVPINCKVNGQNTYYRTTGTAVAYYYQSGAWVQTQVATGAGCRLSVPDNYKGWVYAPLSSYTKNSGADVSIYNEQGVGLAGVTLNYVNLYSNGYVFDTEKNVIWDEVLFVKETESLEDLIPTKLPSDKDYEIKGRIGLDDAVTSTPSGTKFWGIFEKLAGIFKGALKFASGVFQGDTGATTAKDPATVTEGSLAMGEATVTPSHTISLEGVTGVMWYVDFSGVDKGTQTSGFCTSVPLGCKVNGVNAYYRSNATGAVGYYYQNGAWIQTQVATSAGCRMSVPDNYRGWVYVPLSSYKLASGSGEIMDASGAGLAGVTLNYVNLYSNGYVKDTEKHVIWDEVLFVSKTESLEDYIPATLPDNVTYDVQGRVSLDAGSATAQGNKYWGDFSTTAGIYGGALSFASGVYQNTASGATSALDPTTVTEGTLTAGETTVYPTTAIDLGGVKGILFHVDLSKVTPSSATAKFGATVTIGGKNAANSNFNYRSFKKFTNGTGIGYYYLNGEWVQSACLADVNARIQVPQNFCGWVYIPLSAYCQYSGSDMGIIGTDGLGVAGTKVSWMSLYTSGYTADKDKNITYDEILFVK